MPFLDHVLQTPSCGWKDDKGRLVKPNGKQKQFYKDYHLPYRQNRRLKINQQEI
jgi:hypothetical protein